MDRTTVYEVCSLKQLNCTQKTRENALLQASVVIFLKEGVLIAARET